MPSLSLIIAQQIGAKAAIYLIRFGYQLNFDTLRKGNPRHIRSVWIETPILILTPTAIFLHLIQQRLGMMGRVCLFLFQVGLDNTLAVKRLASSSLFLFIDH